MTSGGDDFIDPAKPLGDFVVNKGIQGATAISMVRRLHDSRFATRYFTGRGLDVGGGIDPLALYAEFFPLITNVVIYDRPQGDAQKLANVADNSFDFLFSSHCLEHMSDVREALRNWIRVVRPGGHLVVAVPDEDLYEQGIWPSTFNPEHKASFTLSKKDSWSPVSINLFELLGEFSLVAQPMSVTTIDHGFRYRMPRFDQTHTPVAEAAIEFILVKKPLPVRP